MKWINYFIITNQRISINVNYIENKDGNLDQVWTNYNFVYELAT